MRIELVLLGWSLVLALVHVLAAAHVRTRQYGIAWNTGPRDAAVPPPTPLAGRLMRAQANYYESLPLFAAAVLGCAAAGRLDALSATGAWLWLAARVAYLPLYAAGVPVVRSLTFLASLAGLLLILRPLLAG